MSQNLRSKFCAKPSGSSPAQSALRTFEGNADPLEGLVGFDTGHVYRPGVAIHAFQENEGVHKRYNDEVAAMVEGLFSKPPSSRRTDRTEDAHRYARGDVSLIPFDSDKSEALHDSLGLAQGKPLDRTDGALYGRRVLGEDRQKQIFTLGIRYSLKFRE